MCDLVLATRFCVRGLEKRHWARARPERRSRLAFGAGGTPSARSRCGKDGSNEKSKKKKETKKEKRKRNADRRVLKRPHLRMRRALSAARSPLGVPPRHLRQRTNAAAQLQLRASWD